MDLARAVYALTDKFPREEIYGLVSQMRRAAVSIASNIAEGKLRSSHKEFRLFLYIAYGSGAELETQAELSKTLPKTKGLDYSLVDSLLDEVMKMLNAMINKINQSSNSLRPKA